MEFVTGVRASSASSVATSDDSRARPLGTEDPLRRRRGAADVDVRPTSPTASARSPVRNRPEPWRDRPASQPGAATADAAFLDPRANPDRRSSPGSATAAEHGPARAARPQGASVADTDGAAFSRAETLAMRNVRPVDPRPACRAQAPADNAARPQPEHRTCREGLVEISMWDRTRARNRIRERWLSRADAAVSRGADALPRKT